MNVIWTIAGSDASGGAGVQADLQTFHHFDVHACSIITAATAQNAHTILANNFLSREQVETQLQALHQTFSPAAIKLGMLGNEEIIALLKDYFTTTSAKIVLDPVMTSTSGIHLYKQAHQQYVQQIISLFPYVDLLTPNLPEAEALLNCRINTHDDMVQAAHDLLKLGVKSVVLKAGHLAQGEFSHDYWTNGHESFWLSAKRYPQKNYRGSGCVFSSAVAASLAQGHDIKEALVLAKMYVTRGIRLARHADEKTAYLHHAPLPLEDLPLVSDQPLDVRDSFPSCDMKQTELYPVVDSSDWLKKLLPLGIKTIQLRIKNKQAEALKNEIRTAIELANHYHAKLFVNDHWQLAIELGAYGVHLGQEDLQLADIKKIHAAGLRLGLSTHCYHEMARAYAFNPSYLACGPVFATNSKAMSFMPQGVEKLKYWRSVLRDQTLVAIGGIDEKNFREVLQTKMNGIAMISAITHSAHPEQTTKLFLKMINDHANINS